MNNTDVAQRHEKSIAMALGGRVVPGSGSQWHNKGDVVTNLELVECKVTRFKSYSVKLDVWDKLCDEASTRGREPVLAVRLNDNNRQHTDLIVISLSHYMEITGR